MTTLITNKKTMKRWYCPTCGEINTFSDTAMEALKQHGEHVEVCKNCLTWHTWREKK